MPEAPPEPSLFVTEVTYYRWRNEYGGLKGDQVKRLRELETSSSGLGPASQISFSMINRWSALGGLTMVGTTSDWEDELGRWLKPFLDCWVRRRGGECARCMFRGSLDRAIVKASSRWQRGWRRATMTSYTISLLTASGTRRRWSRNCWFRSIAWSAAKMRCSSTTPRCRRRAIVRLVSLRNMPCLSARRPIAKHWCR